jgi:hypothetical protein
VRTGRPIAPLSVTAEKRERLQEGAAAQERAGTGPALPRRAGMRSWPA